MAKDDWSLGQTSKQYETGGRGAGTISSGNGDYGGVSYGAYQLSSKRGTLKEYLDSSPYGRHFDGLSPVTSEFNAKWRELARTDPGFEQDQHDFIKRTHYDVQVDKLKNAGLDLTDRGPAVQDALWSTSVQFRNLTPRIFSRGLEEKFGKDYELSKLSDKDIVEAIQDYKIAHNKQLFSKSPKLWVSLERRAHNEKATLVELAERDLQVDRTQQQRESQSSPSVASVTVLKQGSEGQQVRDLQEQLAKLGYVGKNGQPLALDGKFGSQTEHAVREFQTIHGLKPVDGIAGSQTMNALEQARQQPLITEATHPNHALYQTIAQKLPAGTDPKVVANVTLQAMENGIDAPGKVGVVHVSGSNVHVLGAGNDPGLRSRTDLNAPTADLQEMSDHMARETAQQQQQLQQQQRQQQHAHGFAP